MKRVPITKKENVYFGLMMCCGMVIGMTFYNLFTTGMLESITLTGMLIQLMMTFFTAALVELFLVGPVAKKLAMALPYDKSKSGYVVLTLAFFMVSGMVLIMSGYGLLLAYDADVLVHDTLLGSYLTLVARNFVFALPLQLLIVGPLVRLLFMRYVSRTRMSNSLSPEYEKPLS
jgi:hypothetical protein